jgi:NitT/TauT family transport system ATP-binding protein
VQQQALSDAPVLSSIVQTLRNRHSDVMRADFFLDLWDEYFLHEEAERQYVELFEYDASEEHFTSQNQTDG